MAPPEILIVGCSVAGPALASFLLLSPTPASEKPHITILEQAPSLRTTGQNIDIRGAGVTLIRKLGIEAEIRASTTGEEGVQWVDSDNCVWGAFPADRSGRFSTPTADIEILRGRLATICYDRSKVVSDQVRQAGGAGIEYIFGDRLEEIEQDGDQVHVCFAKSGERRSFDLVVGADGLQSRTRRMVWGTEGEEERLKRLGLYGAFFSMPRSETDSEWRRWYHAAGRRGLMVRPHEDKDKTTIFMSVINEQDQRLIDVAARDQGADKQKQLMAEYFQDAGWESERCIREMMKTDDFYYDMVGQVKMDKWSKGRVALVGDAGYCASPISGMGTTLAFSGAYNLAGCLAKHDFDYDAAFAEYNATMRPVVDRAQKLVPGAPHSLFPETAWGVWALNAFAGVLCWTGLVKILIMLKAGPPAHSVPVIEYGLRDFKQ